MKTRDFEKNNGASVAVIGGGITGLTAAFHMQERGIPVTVYEASGRVGGVIKSIEHGGYLAESGPNTILETSPKVANLVADLGLESRRLYSDPAAKNRYVVHDRKLVNMPSSPLGFVATPLLSTAAKLRLLVEPFIAPAPEIWEESVAQFAVRRFGREFLDHAIDALVSGVYAGDPERLSVPHAFPHLRRLEQRYGSLIKGQILDARARARGREDAKPNAPKFSFDRGLQVLTDTLYRRISQNVRLFAPVVEITQTESCWVITTDECGIREQHRHSSVLYAGTAFRLPQINLVSGRYVNALPLTRIQYPPVASVVLGYRRDQVQNTLEGFGMLIPRREGFNILGTIFSSSLFPNRAPADHITLTSHLGGARSPESALRPESELFRLARADLRELLGVTGQPTFEHCTVFPKAIPQYEVGFGRFRTLMNEIENKAPGLFLAGHYRDGISLADSIVSAYAAAERIDRFLVTASIDSVSSDLELVTQA